MPNDAGAQARLPGLLSMLPEDDQARVKSWSRTRRPEMPGSDAERFAVEQAQFVRLLKEPRVQALLIRPIRSRLGPQEYDRLLARLGFKTVGPGEWDETARQPGWGWEANQTAKPLDRRFGLSNGNWKDGRRHAEWSAELARRIGVSQARIMQDAHERSAPNPPGDRLMDLINNHNARILARALPQVRAPSLSALMLMYGWMQTSPVAVTW